MADKIIFLLLGVEYDSCTSFHLSESLIEEICQKKNGERCWTWFDDYDIEGFMSIGKDFEKSCNVTKGKVGNAKCRLFDMKEGVDFAKEWLLKYRFAR